MITVEEYTRKNSEAWELLDKFMPKQTDGSLGSILSRVSRETDCLVRDLKGKARRQPLSRARQLFMFRAKSAGFSQSAIARFLGVDHTSVIHGVRTIQAVRDGKVKPYMDAELK